MGLVKKRSLNELLIKSFWGQSLEEIIDYYPKTIEVQDVLDLLIQNGDYDALPYIGYYQHNLEAGKDDINAMSGFLYFCTTAQQLAQRTCYALVENCDDNLTLEQRKYLDCSNAQKRNCTSFKRKDYEVFVETIDKRFITKFELEELIDKLQSKQSFASLIDLPFSLESLYLMLYEHMMDYGLDERGIIDTVLTKGNHRYNNEGVANEFLKYDSWLGQQYYNHNNYCFSRTMTTEHFFDDVSIMA